MRTACAYLLLGFAMACGDPRPPDVAQVQIRSSGWSGTDINVNRRGEGRFRVYEGPDDRTGTFSLSSQQFDRLLQRLEPFRREAEPVTNESVRELIERRCPEGVPFTTDSGAVWIRWIGPGSDQHYLADLGCDAERQAGRNRELQSIIDSLPVPGPR